jgi:ABC-type glycerol-3-phosphate transport system permease component
VPLSKPVLATLSIYDGLNVWNNFILPLVLTQSNSVAVLPLGLTKLEAGRLPALATLPAGSSSVLVVIATKTDERSRSRLGGSAPASVARLPCGR